MTLSPNKILASSFLLSFALIPLLGLFWDESIGNFKVNWIIYPLLIFMVSITIFFRNSADKKFLFSTLLFVFFFIEVILHRGDWQDTLRFFFSLLPFFFMDTILKYQTERTTKGTLRLFTLCLMIPIFISLLQMSGAVPFYEYDTTGGVVVGRLSGGYSKPNNFVAVMFPFLLFGFHLFLLKKRRILAALLIFFILFIIYKTGLRIAVLAYTIILLFSFFPKIFISIIIAYYRYSLNLILGLVSFFAIFLFQMNVGLVDGLRGRFPIWEAHATEFFTANPIAILFGRGRIQLEETWDGGLVKYLNEAHNNSYRIIILYGIIGFLFYSLLIRYFAMKILRSPDKTRRLFASACFLFYIFYSVTNEPAFYPAVMWSIFFWVFIKNEDVPGH